MLVVNHTIVIVASTHHLKHAPIVVLVIEIVRIFVLGMKLNVFIKTLGLAILTGWTLTTMELLVKYCDKVKKATFVIIISIRILRNCMYASVSK